MIVGYSTGSLAKGNFIEALDILNSIPNPSTAIELSTLREHELPKLISAISTLDLSRYTHISIHAPSKLVSFTEDDVITYLLEFAKYNLPIIIHPDIIVDFDKWMIFGDLLCIENMDKRKSIGRTSKDLLVIFERLPNARFCLDFAHAKQVDPTMAECAKMLRLFGHKLAQFHISDVTSDCNHVPINVEAIASYRKVAKLIPTNLPFIIESPVTKEYFIKEMQYVKSIFHINQHYRNNNHSFVSDQF